MVGKSHLLHSMHHLLIASLLILKGFLKFSHYPVLGSIILLFGIIILVYFFYVLSKKQTRKGLDLTVHLFEAIVSLFTAYISFQEGARFLPYVFLLAAVLFIIASYVSYFKKGQDSKTH